MDIIELLTKAKMPTNSFAYFNGGKLVRATLDMTTNKTGFYHIVIELRNFIPASVYIQLVENLKEALQTPVAVFLNVDSNDIKPQLLQEYITQYIEVKENDNKHLQFLKHQQLVVRNNKVNISFDSILKENVLNMMKDKIQRYLNAAGFKVEIQFVYIEKEEVDFDYERDIQNLFSNYTKEKHDNPKQKVEEKPTYNYSNNGYSSNYRPSQSSFKNKLFEKVELDKIDSDIVDIDVSCKVFDVVDDGVNKKRFKLYVTNYKTSYIANIYVNKKYSADFIGSLKNKWVQIKGSLMYNAYEKDNVISVCEIEEIESKDVVYTDNAEIKRVELHAHTSMSAMDGISPVEELVNQAAAYNHKAIAITDHNSLQAFPKAQSAQASLAKKGKDIKIIYGVETNIVPRTLEIIKNPSNVELKDATYVAFDIETTGLSCRFDKIIEFGAVKFKNGQEIEHIDILINPGFKLNNITKKLTHIDDSMLRDKNPIEKELNTIKEFLGDSIIMAHNATFDIGFLEEVFGHELTNPVIDTLPLSRVLNKEATKHSLGAIARRENIDYDEESAHRADYDAYVLKEVYDVMLSKITSDGNIVTHADLEKLQSNDVVKRSKPYHTNLLVKNSTGLKNLFKLMSVANTTYFTETSLVPKNLVEQYKEGILVGSSCARGEVFEIASTKSETELKKIMKFYDFIEIQPIDQYQILVDTEKVESMEKVEQILKSIIKAAKARLPCCQTKAHPRLRAYRRPLFRW